MTKTPDIEKLDLTAEDRPDDVRKSEKDVRRMLTGKKTGDLSDMREAQRQMWDSMTARMDHADEQNARTFDNVADHKGQAERFAKKEAKDTRVHRAIKAELITLDNKLSALDVTKKCSIWNGNDGAQVVNCHPSLECRPMEPVRPPSLQCRLWSSLPMCSTQVGTILYVSAGSKESDRQGPGQ